MTFIFNPTLPREAFAEFKKNRTVKYADELVLVAKEEMVLQGMIVRINEVGR
jgi:hypothetical protein